MFDQYGNYVVQTMLTIAGKYRGKREWFDVMRDCIMENEYRLAKYSSGQKMIGLYLFLIWKYYVWHLRETEQDGVMVYTGINVKFCEEWEYNIEDYHHFWLYTLYNK